MKLFNKPTMLAMGAIVSVALVAVVGSHALGFGSAQTPVVSVNTAGGITPSETFTVGGYLPTWLGDAEYARIAQLDGIDTLYIAFATVDSSGNVVMPTLTPAAVKAINTLGKKAQAHQGGVYLSVGGWGSSVQQHDDMLTGFAAGLNRPSSFAANFQKSVAELQKTTGLTNIGLDLDIEYPTVAQARQLPALVDNLHRSGVSDVAMAVAASGKEAEGVLGVAHTLAGKGVRFNVMTYDMSGLGSAKAGPIATTAWAVNNVAAWVRTTGDASMVSVGFPTYCYTFVGARQAGDRFDSAASVTQHRYFKDLPATSIREDSTAGTTTAELSDGYTTCVSPKRATATLNAVLHNHPTVGGSFAWDLRGMTGDYSTALSGTTR